MKLPDFDKVVDVAYTGERAITLMAQNIRRVSKFPLFSITNLCDYDVIFMDCSMPFMDGYE
eukprot:CAMPEP_0170497616 /NCGR_PEP_ID=MMETSP0208-20121228/25260_1 /TAXON_ID=197538 /ORGANISM="Strombidium inclinatum, Strain S3" /LENGTH=60 /DNA_ID=CAMNT_0010774483 /DNA_START=323 /DNA_END=502 /DNA_ORIENTATION=-